jgi:Outer membrane lipoprotein-sorting protein
MRMTTRRIFPATQFAVAAMILFASFGAFAEPTNGLSDAEIQGRALAQKILEQSPATNLTQTGVLNIRDAKGQKLEIPLQFEIIVTATNWQNIYKTIGTNGVCLKIIHADGQPDWYSWSNYNSGGIVSGMGEYGWSGTQWTHPLPGDFWAVDLGLEFFHWPDQKILKEYEMRRGRACKVLQSTNPNPSPNGYSRVVSWIDNETLGIVHAEAYDAKGKLLKVFDPKSFKKVNGQWELQEMEIRNVQTGSRSWIEFDVKNK